MVFLVTGGTGLVGWFLLEKIASIPSLNEKGCRVIVRNSESRERVERLGLSPVKADLNDVPSLKKAVEKGFADLEMIKKDHDLNAIRNEKSFKELIQKMKNGS